MGDMPDEWYGLGIPKSITFCVTEACNLACKYCYMTGKNNLKKMSFETAKKTVDFILANREQFDEPSVIWEFIGGEPFLEIDLIDKISDYIKLQMFLLDHPWFNSYRFSFSTNGLLYHTEKVQNYIKKNRNHISIGMSVDGNKIKHDLQRIKPDGTGSYDDVVKNVPLWLEQFPGGFTKATFSHDDLPYLKDSVISLWNLGIKSVSANVVFEDVWQEGDDMIMEQQLRELADYILEKELWKEYSVRFFDPNIGNPLEPEDLSRNFCGAGKMLAVDTQGNFSPCVRFLSVSLSNRPTIMIGNADEGINNDKLRPFHALDLVSQSLPECINCEVASGCNWCQGCNYDLAETTTIYERATYLCKIHKATVRANKYFWNEFEKKTGLISKRKKKNHRFYLYFITSDTITPHCSYKNLRGTNEVMSEEVFRKGIAFCKKENMIPVLLGKPVSVDENLYNELLLIDESGAENTEIGIYNNQIEKIAESEIGILLFGRQNIAKLFSMVQILLNQNKRVNLVIEDLQNWNQDDFEQYDEQLSIISEFVYSLYINGKEPEINVLTDLWEVKEMKNCEAGRYSYALAPNGKIYVCPGFYFENSENAVGDLETGIHVKNAKLYELERAPICKTCDVFNCERCKFQNVKTTGEINTPSRNQCLLHHIQRNASMILQKKLIENGFCNFENIIKEIDYLDPLDHILKTKN